MGYRKPASGGGNFDGKVLPRFRHAQIDLPPDAGIQDVFRCLADDQARTEAIAAEVCDAFPRGRKVLVLTERQRGYRAMGYRIEAEAALYENLL